MHKIRIIVNDVKPAYGITIPPSIGERWFNTFVSITEESGRIILTSGALPNPFNKKELKLHIQNSEKVKL